MFLELHICVFWRVEGDAKWIPTIQLLAADWQRARPRVYTLSCSVMTEKSHFPLDIQARLALHSDIIPRLIPRQDCEEG